MKIVPPLTSTTEHKLYCLDTNCGWGCLVPNTDGYIQIGENTNLSLRIRVSKSTNEFIVVRKKIEEYKILDLLAPITP